VVSTNADISSDNLRLPEAGRQKLARISLFVAGLFLLLSVLVSNFGEGGLDHYVRAYIHNFCFILSLALGAMFFVIIQHLTRAGWSVVVRRIAEVVAATMPILALLFLPILIPVVTGRAGVYEWTAAGAQHDDVIQRKSAYLNVPFFLIRIAICFGVWIFLSRYFLRASVMQDESGDPEITRRLQKYSAPAVIAYGLTLTFFAFDVLMSLAPHWYSTMFGVYYFAGSVVGFNALLALIVYILQRNERLTKVITLEHYHDLGKLIFAFVVFWTYIAYSQYMLQWYANMPEETIWYRARQSNPWLATVGLTLLFGHFVAPFLLLISRIPKKVKPLLCFGAGLVLLMHWLDIYWLAMPITPHPENPAAENPVRSLQVADIGCLLGLGGVFLWAIINGLSRQSLVPQRDPRLPESLAFENF
jgi:hypothetical protein